MLVLSRPPLDKLGRVPLPGECAVVCVDTAFLRSLLESERLLRPSDSGDLRRLLSPRCVETVRRLAHLATFVAVVSSASRLRARLRYDSGDSFVVRRSQEGHRVVNVAKLRALLAERGVPCEQGRRLDDVIIAAESALGDHESQSLLRSCSVRTSVVQIRGGPTVSVGFEMPRAVLATRGEKTAILAENFRADGHPIPRLARTRKGPGLEILGLALAVLDPFRATGEETRQFPGGFTKTAC